VLEQPNLMEDAKHLVRVDRAEGQVVVRIAAVVEVEAAEHLLREQPRDDLLDVLRQVMMAGVDEHARLRPRRARQQQRHAPVADVGVIEGGLERLVFDEQPLGRRERRVTGLQPLDEPRAPLPDVGGTGIVGPVREPE